MKTNLPTTSGQHWFKECGSDNWRPYYVTTLDGLGLICHCAEDNITSRCLVYEMPAGQWAKVHKPDEGIEAWAVVNRHGNIDVCWLNETHTRNFVKQWAEVPPGGITCEPVTIFRKEKE